MKKNIVWFTCLIALLLSTGIAASAQSYHLLTLDDFQTSSSGGSDVVAYTNCTINFKYAANKERGYYRLDFTITMKMNNDKSWIDKRRITSREVAAEILKHEQGHYAIAYLEQQELLRAVSKTVFYDDYQYQASRIFKEIDNKYKLLNQNYDDDTNHMTNRAQQRSWDAYFKKRIDYEPPA